MALLLNERKSDISSIITDEDFERKKEELALQIFTSGKQIIPVASGEMEARKERNRNMQNYLDLLSTRTFGITRFLPESFDRAQEYDENLVKPSWFMPYYGSLFSLKLDPVFTLNYSEYGPAYVPKSADMFIEAISLALSCERFRGAIDRGSDLTTFYTVKRNIGEYIKDLFIYSQTIEPVNLREILSDRMKMSMEESGEEVCERLCMTERAKLVQRKFGTRLVYNKEDRDRTLFNVYGEILDMNGNTVLIHGKPVHFPILNKVDKGVFEPNSNYFYLGGGKIFYQSLKEKRNNKIVEIQSRFPSEIKGTLKVELKADEFQSFLMGSVIERDSISKSYQPYNIYSSLRSKGLGDISHLIGVVSELANVSIFVFDETFENLKMSGISNNSKAIIMRMARDGRVELGGVVEEKNTIVRVKFLFDERDDIIKVLKTLRSGHIYDTSPYDEE